MRCANKGISAASGEKCSIVSPQNSAWPLLDASQDPNTSACLETTLYGVFVILKAARNVSLSPYLAWTCEAGVIVFWQQTERSQHETVVRRIALVDFRCNEKCIPCSRAIDDHLPTFKFILARIVRQALRSGKRHIRNRVCSDKQSDFC